MPNNVILEIQVFDSRYVPGTMLVAENTAVNKNKADSGTRFSMSHEKESMADFLVSMWYLKRTRPICQYLSKMHMHLCLDPVTPLLGKYVMRYTAV